MAVRTLPFLFLLLASVSLGHAEDPAVPPAVTIPDVAPKSEAFLRNVFQSQFSKEQLGEFKEQPTLRQLIEQMSPEQKQGARTKLGDLEQQAATPEDLAEIARGYLLLDEHEPNAGTQAIRIAGTIQQQDPENSLGFTLAASGYHQSGDYPAATEWAKKALELNPDDKTARAVYMLSVGRIKRSGAGLPGVAGTPALPPASGGFASLDWEIVVKDASPQAIALMKQAVAARRVGNADEPIQLAREAMRIDPGSLGVQKFYALVDADYKKHAQTKEYLDRAIEALRAGNGTEAVSWAQKAADLSQSQEVYKLLALTKQKAEEMAQQPARQDTKKQEKDSPAGFPLLPLAVPFGLGVLGYGVSKSKSSWSEQESEQPADEDPNSERIQQNRYHLKVAVVSAAIGFGIVYGGVWLMGAAGSATIAAKTPQGQQVGSTILSTGQRWAGQVGQVVTNLAQKVRPGQSAVLEQQLTQEFAALRTLGQTGSSQRIRLVQGGVQEAQALFQQLSRNGRVLPQATYPGKLVELSNGARVGLRLKSTSGPPTIDVHGFPGFAQNLEIKFIQ